MESNNNCVPNSSLQKPQYDVNEAFENKLKYLKVSDLQHILRKHSLHTTGNKLSLIGRICDYFKNATNKFNAGQISPESIASMFAEVEALYGTKLNTTARGHHPAASSSVPTTTTAPSNGTSNGSSNGSSNGIHVPGVSPYIQHCFEENSFCQHQSVVTQVRVLNLKESHGGHVFNFDLPKEIGSALYTNNINLLVQQESKYCIQLFSFDTKKLEAGHAWPVQQTAAHFEVRVNHRVFQVKRGGKKDKDRVADITSYCRPGNNSITILWNGSGNYQLYVTASKRIPVETLVDTVVTKRTRDYDASVEAIKKTLARRAGSDELQEVSTKVSLMCPATKAVMHIPCRATTCNHLQCFELQSYLMMNERVPRWQCPHCSKTALYKDLFADSFFKKVIEQVSKADITEIEFKSDGSWLPVSKKRKVEQIENNKQVFEILDEDDTGSPTNNYTNNIQKAPSNLNLSRSNSFTNNNSNNNTSTNTFSSSSLPSSAFSILPTNVSSKPTSETSQYGYDINKCFVCGALNNLKRCSRCRGICYCGVECQGQDWERHRDECRDLIPPNNSNNSTKTDTDSQYAQQKYKMQKKEGLSALAESATAVAYQGMSGNADDPIELD